MILTYSSYSYCKLVGVSTRPGVILTAYLRRICSGCDWGGCRGGRVFSPAEVCPVPIKPEPLDCRESSLKPMCCLGGFFPLPTASLLGVPFTSCTEDRNCVALGVALPEEISVEFGLSIALLL